MAALRSLASHVHQPLLLDFADNCVHLTLARICTLRFQVTIRLISHVYESRERYNAVIYSCHVPTCQGSLTLPPTSPCGVQEVTNLTDITKGDVRQIWTSNI